MRRARFKGADLSVDSVDIGLDSSLLFVSTFMSACAKKADIEQNERARCRPTARVQC